MRKLLVGYQAWKNHHPLLDGMTLGDLLRAYVTYPSIQLNIALAAIALAVTLAFAESVALLVLIAAIAIVVYSIVEYVFHRYILHGRMLYRRKATAALWKRVHYDHHQDTANMAVLFGDPKTTIPPILIIAIPPGYLIHGIAGAAFAVFCGVVMVSIYELCHFYQHVPYEPRNLYLRRLKKRHLAHHFHNETGNFGITSHVLDVALGTNYESFSERPRSASVRHLGYAGEEAERFPWVMELSSGDPGTGKRH